MSKPLSMQEVIMRLERFWADHGCVIWQPYNVQVGAGTMNPATVLRVLGPEPWNVAYVEPSIRPDDGRYGENPNRWQQFYQYQVILKPDPGNPQELYLQSLKALGIDLRPHDVRFVEDNWEAPALGAWGLGWEVWLDGLEITQFTYFQQAGGFAMDPVSVELTYGIERIVMFLQDARRFVDIDWGGGRTYGDVLLPSEIEYCKYNFEFASVGRLVEMFHLFEDEAKTALGHGLVFPAHDYVLKCSHTFNVLDARGAIGVTERAKYFARMRDVARQVSIAYVNQREQMGHPWGRPVAAPKPALPPAPVPTESHDFVLEVGTEELPWGDLEDALGQLSQQAPLALAEARLQHEGWRVQGTPRRLVLQVSGLEPRQSAQERVVKGPPLRAAYAEGRPTKAAEGFARSAGVTVSDLQTRTFEGREYVVAVTREEGRPAGEVLCELLPALVGSLRFGKSMRWNASQVLFSRPIRWFVSLLGDQVVPFRYAGVTSGRVSRGTRSEGALEMEIPTAEDYSATIERCLIVLDVARRREMIWSGAKRLAQEVGGTVPEDPALLAEVANLVEQPTLFRGTFDQRYLRLPAEVLITVMKKHQRYFPVVDAQGRLLPYFVAARNGDSQHLDQVTEGNEAVLAARYADAEYFYDSDTRRHLEDLLPRLGTLTFQEQLGSMLDKARRLEELVEPVADALGLAGDERAAARRAAHLCKADLASQMVVELTSLQGVVGREYARLSGEPDEVALAIAEHYQPRVAGDAPPESAAGAALALADRLDSLVGLFAVGLIPSGSADPHGLRRSALGVVQILLARSVPVDLRDLIGRAAVLMPVPVSDSVRREVLDFVVARLSGLLREGGNRYDVVDAVLAERGHNPRLASRSVERLAVWVAREDWTALLNAYGRTKRIVRDLKDSYRVDPMLLQEPASAELHQAYLAARDRLSPGSSVDELLQALMGLVPAINRFFVDVLVMAEDPAVRQTRLGLCQAISSLADGIVDLTRIEGF